MYTKGTNKVTSKTGIISITPPFLEKEGLFLTILNKEFSAIEKDIPSLTFIESFCEFFKVFKNYNPTNARSIKNFCPAFHIANSMAFVKQDCLIYKINNSNSEKKICEKTINTCNLDYLSHLLKEILQTMTKYESSQIPQPVIKKENNHLIALYNFYPESKEDGATIKINYISCKERIEEKLKA